MDGDSVSLTKKNYKKRLIDDLISQNLKIFGAISIEGPKWCGKTWTALNHSNSVIYLNDTSNNFKNKKLAEMNVDLILNEENPQLIDEWQEVPAIWDAIRYRCDMDNEKGKYILTGSATPVSNLISHSGAGRIARMKMYTMSLYESGHSTGDVSLLDLLNNRSIGKKVKETKLTELAEYIVKGGWPETIELSAKLASRITKSYLEAVLEKDIIQIDGVKRDKRKMEMLLRSLARNESTNCTNVTLIKDICEDDEFDLEVSRNTVSDYLEVLNKLHLIENQKSFMYKIRSKSNVGKNPKRHFVDPSLACAALGLTVDKLMNDLNTFGLLFESLCERDLKIYANTNDANLYHYRDNVSGLEIDSIIEFSDGEFGAIEIKLGSNMIEDAVANLLKFNSLAEVKPKFMAVICGVGIDAIIKRQDGIYLLPITALKN